MYCQKCGLNCENNHYCQRCGTKISPVVIKKEPNTCAIVGFILSFFMPLAGFILGIIGLSLNYRCNPNHKGFAIAAVVLGNVIPLISAISVGVWYANVIVQMIQTIL